MAKPPSGTRIGEGPAHVYVDDRQEAVIQAYRSALGWGRTFQFNDNEFDRIQYDALLAAARVLRKQGVI